MSEDVIPRLFSVTMQSRQSVPETINSVFIILILLTLAGVFLPVGILLFQLPLPFSFISIGFIGSILLFIILSIYPYVLKQINIEQ